MVSSDNRSPVTAVEVVIVVLLVLRGVSLTKTLYLWIEECRRSGATAARQIEKTWAGEGRG